MSMERGIRWEGSPEGAEPLTPEDAEAAGFAFAPAAEQELRSAAPCHRDAQHPAPCSPPL